MARCADCGKAAIRGYARCYHHLTPDEAAELTGTIYAIVSRQRVHYVGSTIRPLHERLSDHVTEANTYGRLYGDGSARPKFKATHQFTGWLWRTHMSKGTRPEIVTLATVPFTDLHEAEVAAIAEYRALGEPLKNKIDTMGYAHKRGR